QPPGSAGVSVSPRGSASLRRFRSPTSYCFGLWPSHLGLGHYLVNAAPSNRLQPTARLSRMTKRTELAPTMTEAEFENGYWYATELQEFAAKVGIPSAKKLRKDELEKA